MSLRGERGRELYELGLKLGSLGTVTVGCAGGSLARALARVAACGVVLAGGDAKLHDGSCAACGVWLSRYYGLAASVFVRQEGSEVTVHVRDGEGRPFLPDLAEETAPCTGEWEVLSGTDRAWAAGRAMRVTELGTAAVEGPGGLALLLERLGYTLVSEPGRGIPLFRADREGFDLTVEADGSVFYPAGEDALECAASYVYNCRAVPAFRVEEGLF